MHALIIYESMFGNTRKIAEAIAAGLADTADIAVTDVVDAPPEPGPHVDLVVIGGPTHAFSMSRESTRHSAAERGGAYSDVPEGIREWIARQVGRGRTLVAFDTRVDMPLVPGAASRAASRAARRRGFRVLSPRSFLVEGYEGPLRPGEVERAREWGRRLGVDVGAAASATAG